MASCNGNIYDGKVLWDPSSQVSPLTTNSDWMSTNHSGLGTRYWAVGSLQTGYMKPSVSSNSLRVNHHKEPLECGHLHLILNLTTSDRLSSVLYFQTSSKNLFYGNVISAESKCNGDLLLWHHFVVFVCLGWRPQVKITSFRISGIHDLYSRGDLQSCMHLSQVWPEAWGVFWIPLPSDVFGLCSPTRLKIFWRQDPCPLYLLCGPLHTGGAWWIKIKVHQIEWW